MDNRSETIRKALEFEPYENLVDLVDAASEHASSASDNTVQTQCSKTVTRESARPEYAVIPAFAQSLALDVTTYPTSAYKPRGLRLKLSMRQLAKAKVALIAGGYVKEIVLEKFLFLAGTEKLYEALEMLSPYQRNVSLEHSFLELLAKESLQTDPMVQKVNIEAPVGTRGASVDLVATLKNGDRWAFEITCSLNNVAANAAKLHGQAFSRVIFLCRDHHVRDAATAILRNAGFDSSFSIKLDCVLISSLIRQQKTFFKERASS